ncbi:MAG: hypothetical protein AABY32_01770 [Nanoarchaeota archaeon]
MFFCDDCAKKNKWPTAIGRSIGKCEVCGKSKSCNELHHTHLPIYSNNQTVNANFTVAVEFEIDVQANNKQIQQIINNFSFHKVESKSKVNIIKTEVLSNVLNNVCYSKPTKYKYNFNSLAGINFHNIIDITYNTETTCEESGCDQEGICRCSTIENAIVKDKDLISKLIKYMNIDFITGDMMDKIEKILINNHIKNQNSWKINITQGYYGEEIDSVFIDEDIARNIDNQIQNLIK